MSFERAKAALASTRFADLRWVPETGSTNDDVRRALLDRVGAPAPVVLLADHQRAGRGRLERRWEAPAGSSILMSIGLPAASVPVERRPLLTLALALAVTDVRAEVTIKWPNDLVVSGPAGDPLGYRKVGGILAEAHSGAGDDAWVVLGLGLNVNWPAIPDDLAAIATSLNVVEGGEVDREALVTGILEAFDSHWLPLLEGPDEAGELVAACRRRSATIGTRVRVTLPGSELVGRADDIGADGALVVLDDDGVTHRVIAGDVVHVRPTP